MGRAPCCDKAYVKKGPWSPEEDEKLKDYIQTHGNSGIWITLPQKAGLRRCGKSCRLRWLNYLRPNIKHGEFSDDEDKVICTLFASIGTRWSIMAAHLPGRTDNDIKNYWNTKLKKKKMPEVTKPLHHQYMYGTNTSSYHDQALSIPSSPTTTAAAADHHHLHPVLQSQDHESYQGVKDSSTLVIFGGDQASSGSINSDVTVGVYDYNNIGNLRSHSYKEFGRNCEKEKGYYGDSSLDSSLEEINQLISTSNIDNNLNFFVDDTKEIDKGHHFFKKKKNKEIEEGFWLNGLQKERN